MFKVFPEFKSTDLSNQMEVRGGGIHSKTGSRGTLKLRWKE